MDYVKQVEDELEEYHNSDDMSVSEFLIQIRALVAFAEMNGDI